ncbi:uncharacterized protein LOC106770014 [Vigna radiata var. radiata]|uniref:Uncharacterized protein LOC106770014 n=1 Tax=Vigna radiata var. radiata TaxID=3916 RepID=A0A1S3UZ36_VIGRR|nr:uncharacterized protein LOC106770014 [Vigna radiata var. radiata]
MPPGFEETTWIVHFVSISIKQSIIWMNKASKIWNDLKNIFSQGSLSRISSLQLEIATLHQSDLSISEYFTKLRILWDEIENFRLEPPCTCKPDCGCGVLTVFKQKRQEDQVMQFLRGLSDRFNNVTSHMLLLDPIPDITKVFSLVTQQERQLSSGNLIAATKTQDSGTATSYTIFTSSTVYNYCGKNDHIEAVWYRKNGFPNQDKGFKNAPTGRKHCTHCNKSGHTVDVCYKKHGYPLGHKFYHKSTQINHTSTQEENGNVKDTNFNGVDHIRLTPEQFQVLVELFKGHNLKGTSTSAQVHHVGSASANQPPLGNICLTLTFNYPKNNWILDSGATNHIRISLRNFLSYKKIKPIQIVLPNGTIVYSEYSGTLILHNKIHLLNVLYVPQILL